MRLGFICMLNIVIETGLGFLRGAYSADSHIVSVVVGHAIYFVAIMG